MTRSETPKPRRRRRRRRTSPPPRPSNSPGLSFATLVSLLLASAHVRGEEFNFEVGQRVRERLHDYMGDPVTVARTIVEYRKNGPFEHDMAAPDRNAYLKLNDALMMIFPHFESVYYGLEDGVFVGTGFASHIANYREPGESGFAITDPEYRKHVNTCVNETGHSVPCAMVPGNPYIACVDGCSLDKCPDEYSQRDCDNVLDFTDRQDCRRKVKWCKQYKRETAPEEPPGGLPPTPLGFIPRMTHCIDSTGVVSQTPGAIVKKGTDILGNCYYRDGVTMVKRSETDAYGYCGVNGEVCNDTFVGAYLHRDYDPRWRGWYESTKAMQKNNWSPPYPFFTNLEMGITYSEPIYSMIEGKNVFMGVIAVDYTFENITEFLIINYLNSSTAVAIFEEAEPNYMIGSSTGSKAARKVLRANKTQPCPEVNRDTCTADRITISDLGSISDVPMDTILSKAFERQRDAGFPPTELVTVKADDSVRSAVYVSQTQVFELPGAELAWKIMIMSPTSLSSDDSILPGDPLFGFMIAIGVLGFTVCLVLFYLFFQKRRMRAIIVSDWRFTSAFLLGCTLLNTGTLSFLGPNTDGLCMLRMWLSHFFFALAFSPLLVKTWRMMKLTQGGQSYHRVKISHRKAALYCVPIVLTQVVILTVFSIVDPGRGSEIIENNGPTVTHRIVCTRDTKAFFFTELVFEGGLVLLGCVLAFKTRNLRGDFGEAKQLIICMYDIALVGSVVVIVTNVTSGGQAGMRLLYAVGIFWGTAFSSCAFVVPRLIRARDDASQARAVNAATHARRTQAPAHISMSREPSNLSVITETHDEDGAGASEDVGVTKDSSQSSAQAPESASSSAVKFADGV